jgi:undecaprenyl diphosphate synthase
VHVAIIMHGNGQWAMQRGLPSTAGCAAAVAALRNTVALAATAQVKTLTLYSNCSSNGAHLWQEANADLSVLTHFLRDNLRSPEAPVRISLIGNHRRLNGLLPLRCNCNGHLSVAGARLHLRIVIDYSAHDRLIQAACRSVDPHAPEQFSRKLQDIDPTALPAGPVDLLVRTGEGWRPSDFMLWELVYAELHFVDRLWPDFTAGDFEDALNSHARQTQLIFTS